MVKPVEPMTLDEAIETAKFYAETVGSALVVREPTGVLVAVGKGDRKLYEEAGFEVVASFVKGGSVGTESVRR